MQAFTPVSVVPVDFNQPLLALNQQPAELQELDPRGKVVYVNYRPVGRNLNL